MTGHGKRIETGFYATVYLAVALLILTTIVYGGWIAIQRAVLPYLQWWVFGLLTLIVCILIWYAVGFIMMDLPDVVRGWNQ